MLICVSCGNGSFEYKIGPSKQGGTDEEGTEGDRKGTRYEDGRKVNKLANKIIGKTAFLRLP